MNSKFSNLNGAEGAKTTIPSVASSLNGSADGRSIFSQGYQSGKYSETGSPNVRPFSIQGSSHLTFESLASVDPNKPIPKPIHLIYYDSETSKNFS